MPDGFEIDLRGHAGGITYQRELVCCGKRRCKTCGGKRYAHGPYWYAYWKSAGRTRSRYLGRELPESVQQLVGARPLESDLETDGVIVKAQVRRPAPAKKMRRRKGPR